MKVIIVEGCDNTGKDSLINGIANYYGQKHVNYFMLVFQSLIIYISIIMMAC